MLDLAVWQRRFRDYLQLRHFALRTTTNYVAELRPFFDFLIQHGLDSVADVTRDVLETYRTHLFYRETRGRRLCTATQANHLSALKTFLKFLAAQRYILVNPGADLELPRCPQTLPCRLLSETEMEMLLAVPDTTTPLGLRDRAMLEVFYATGIRNSELAGLCLNDVDLAQQELFVRRGKGEKSRRVPLGEEAAGWLARWLSDGRPHFPHAARQRQVFLTWRGEAFCRQVLAVRVLHLGLTAGLAQRVTPHLLRHSCATHMLRHGASLRHLQVMLGHATPATTQRYTKVEISDLQEVHRRCHPRERGWAR
ncbi:MAG: tyrosine-type recombinase/integrase [Candidatus Xenobia bacterium]